MVIGDVDRVVALRLRTSFGPLGNKYGGLTTTGQGKEEARLMRLKDINQFRIKPRE